MNEIPFLYLSIAFSLGALLSFLIMKIIQERKRGVSYEEIEQKYIQKPLFDEVKIDLTTKEQLINQQHSQLAEYKSRLMHMQEQQERHQKELEELNRTFKTEFRNLANDLLEEKSTKFVALNEEKIGNILNPLKEKIAVFEKKIEDSHRDEIRERSSLKKELEQIIKLNQQVSEDAGRLTSALIGDKKLQGNWGEIQLDMILEKAGLEEGIHYAREKVLRTEQGHVMRPDFIVNLPDSKHIVIDSKVSLVDYEKYHNEEDKKLQEAHLKQHTERIKEHIRLLGSKNYHQLYDINSPDYILLFVPIEPALNAALREDIKLFERAMEKNIVIVSVSTLLATLRTISFIWKQENQRKNVMEIARESGALYDKFVGFIDDMQKIGRNIKQTEKEYESAMNKLSTSVKKGDTIIGRIERIKSLGADASKSLPEGLM